MMMMMSSKQLQQKIQSSVSHGAITVDLRLSNGCHVSAVHDRSYKVTRPEWFPLA
jgi:hypothetical protein